MNPVEEVITATEVLADWIGDGGRPVHQMVAEFRAQTCVACVHNVEPNWWDRIKSTVALWMRKGLELKNGMGLRVESEDKLNICAKCGCCLRLKIWAPIEHLKNHVDPKSFASAPDFCWLKKELTT